MQLDDEVPSQPADCAVAPARDGEGEAEARQGGAAKAIARLRSKKGDLEIGSTKSQKVGKYRNGDDVCVNLVTVTI